MNENDGYHDNETRTFMCGSVREDDYYHWKHGVRDYSPMDPKLVMMKMLERMEEKALEDEKDDKG